MNKLLVTLTIMSATVFGAGAQSLKPVELEKPGMERSATLMKALQDRRSTREFAAQDVSLRDLSDLLWAANGVNRPDGHHTAATALNKEDVDIYVLDKNGAYLYVPAENILKPVAVGNFLEFVRGRQVDFPIPPLAIVLTTTPARFEIPDEKASAMMGAVDVGIVAQNIMLFCSAAHLNTVPRASMDSEGLAKALNLPAGTIPVLNLPVGYPVK